MIKVIGSKKYQVAPMKITHGLYSSYSVHHINNPRRQKEVLYKKRQKYTEQQQNKQNYSSSSFNILLIDDDEDILFTFRTIMEGEGYQLTSFSDPYYALDHFAKMDPYHYDLVLMDIRMPGINGIQLYSKIKVMNPDIKVLFLSALDAVKNY
jgi:PleD family two-component response regulator